MARQTIPKGAPVPAGGHLVSGALDSSSNCASSRCAVEVDTPMQPPPAVPAPAPAPGDNPLVPPDVPVPAPVPQLYEQTPQIETGYFNQCSLGMCGPVSSAGRVAMIGDGKTATIQAVPADTFWARQMFAVANGDRRSLTDQNLDWDNSGVRTAMEDPNLVAYAEALRPLFGDAAYSVARSNMLNASGLGGLYDNSGYAQRDAMIRGNAASSMQATALTSGDSSRATTAFGVDPAAFQGLLINEAPDGQPAMFQVDGTGGFTQSSGFRPENVNDTLAGNYGGVPSYMKRVDSAERAAGGLRKQMVDAQAKLGVADITAAGRVRAAQARAAGAKTPSAAMTLADRMALLKEKAALAAADRREQHVRALELNRQRAALRNGGADPTLAPPPLRKAW